MAVSARSLVRMVVMAPSSRHVPDQLDPVPAETGFIWVQGGSLGRGYAWQHAPLSHLAS